MAGVTASDGTIDFQTAAVTEVQSTGTYTVGTAGVDTITVTGVTGTATAGTLGDGVDVTITDSNDTSGTVGTIGFAAGVITIDADITGGVTSDLIAAAIDGLAEFTSSSTGTAALIAGDATNNVDVTSGGVDAVSQVDAAITIAASANGASLNRTITFISTADLGAGVATATDDGTTLAISVDDDTNVDLSAVVTAIEAAIGTTNFTTTLVSTTGDSQFNTTVDTDPTLTNVGATTAGVSASGGLANDIVIELSGTDGSEVLSFGSGTSIAELVNGINQVSDATGVSAVVNGTTATTLDLTSTAYGSSAFVDLGVIEDDAAVFTDSRQEGTDIVASVNGISVTGDGNALTINTATLDLSATLDAGFTGTSSFTITGGGALFQLGPDVVSNQQARLGIGSVNTARLGGVSGKLFRLGTGGSHSIDQRQPRHGWGHCPRGYRSGDFAPRATGCVPTNDARNQ